MGSSFRSRDVFISYRREETAGQASCLYEHLADRLGEDRVFKDTDSIAPGVKFANRIVEDLSVCNVLLVLIGRDWSVVTDSKGARRLDDPHDFVRVEIEIALNRDILVIPVLVDGATLPHADDLPPGLRPLTRRQSCELSDSSFESDVTSLTDYIDEIIKRRKLSRLTVASIHAPAVDVSALAEALRLWYEDQGLEAVMVPIPVGVMVQCRVRQTSRRTSGKNALLNVILRSDGDNLLVDIGSASWLGMANLATKYTAMGGMLAGSWVAASLALPPLAGIVAGVAASTMVEHRWRQYRYSNQTMSFLLKTAPRYISGA